MKRPWIIPVFILILAALACDEGYDPPDPIRILQVQADPDVPGRAYALVGDSQRSDSYETDNYGETWQQSDRVISEEARHSSALRFRDETLLLDDQPLWTFPHRTFRIFFAGFDAAGFNRYAHQLPYGNISNDTSQGVVYVAMGTEGVLVGPSPGSNTDREWRLTSNGIDLLEPLPLTITDPLSIVIVIVLALSIPPLPLIHAYFLTQVWVYILPRRSAWRFAVYTVAGLSATAAAGIAVWLRDIDIAFSTLVAGMSLITAAAGVGLTFYFAHQMAVPAALRNRLAVASFFVSLIVPMGVAAVYQLWWLVFVILFGYGKFKDLYFRGIVGKKRKAKNKRQHWLIDRLTFETLLMAAAIIILLVIALRLITLPGLMLNQSVPLMLFTAIIAIIGPLVLLAFGTWRRFVYLTSMQTDFDPEDPMDMRGFRQAVFAATIRWITFTLGASVVIFVGQMYAAGLLTELVS